MRDSIKFVWGSSFEGIIVYWVGNEGSKGEKLKGNRVLGFGVRREIK